MVQLSYQNEDAKTILIPISAIRHSDDASSVFVYADGKVRKTGVTLGHVHNNGTVEVLAGLKTGDQIVISGVNMLSDGEAVRPTAQPSKTNVGGLL